MNEQTDKNKHFECSRQMNEFTKEKTKD